MSNALSRRTFLSRSGATAAKVAGLTAWVATPASRMAGAAAASSTDTVEATAPIPGPMPTVTIAGQRVSRLVAGGNPVEGYSHCTAALSRHMVEYFTVERTVEFFQQCERLGINTYQSSPKDTSMEALRRARDLGSKLQWICLYADHPSAPPLKDVLALKPIAIVHHGGVTDSRFREGRHDVVLDLVKRIKDAGIAAGVSSHNPKNIAHVAEKGWDIDLFMTCFYHVSRSREEMISRFGAVTVGEPFLETDPDEMSQIIRKVDKPCLAFKLLAAGRLCDNPKQVETAFKSAFARIKSSDGLIVGMYPRFKDEIAENVRLTMQYGNPA